MHRSALEIGHLFVANYWRRDFECVVDIGSYDVNGSLRSFIPEEALYIGVDLESGPGVSVVKAIEAMCPLEDGCADVVVCTSVFEHDDFFWQTFVDMARLLKPEGLLYINAPSNGWFHLHPTDSWRFYPDCGRALTRWAIKCGQPMRIVETFVADRYDDVWNDFVGVFSKGDCASPVEYISNLWPCSNVRRQDLDGRSALRHETQDMLLIEERGQEIVKLKAEIARLNDKMS